MINMFVFPHNRTILAVMVLISLLFTTSPVQSKQKKDILRAGTAKIDITPQKPVKMAGYAGRKDLSDGVHDPLSARVVIFENDGQRLVLVSTYLIGFYNATAETLRKAIME